MTDKPVRNKTMWDRLLAPVVQYLEANPTASAQEASRIFDIPAASIARHLGKQFDFAARRKARIPAPAEKSPAKTVTLDDQTIEKLARRVVALLRPRIIPGFDPYDSGGSTVSASDSEAEPLRRDTPWNGGAEGTVLATW